MHNKCCIDSSLKSGISLKKKLIFDHNNYDQKYGYAANTQDCII